MPAVIIILAIVVLVALLTRRPEGVHWFDHVQDSAQGTLWYIFVAFACLVTFLLVFFVLGATVGLK